MGIFASKEQELRDYEGDDKVVPATEMKERVFAAAYNPTKFLAGMKSLDSIIEGFEGGELIVISGPTKQGKTTFSQTLTANFEKQDVKSLWFSYEVSMRQLFEKFVKAKDFYLPQRLVPKNLDWLEERVIEAKLKYDIKAVFIDHLHYIVDMEKSRNQSIEIGTVIRRLKTIANTHNIVIFLMAHLTKTKYEEAPTESDIRDSSFITQEADCTLLVWRERMKNRKSKMFDYTGLTAVIIANHRRTGVLGKVIKLKFLDKMLLEVDNTHVSEDIGSKEQEEIDL
jgi:replicative DNA helicase